MRPSSTSSRASHAPGSQAPPSTALLARLADKRREVEAVDALQRASALFLRRLEGLADDCEAMADAGIGAYLAGWLAGWRWGAHRARSFFRPLSVVTDLIFWGSGGTFFTRYLLQCMARCSRNGHRCFVPWFCSVRLRMMTTRIIPDPTTAAAREASLTPIAGDDGAGVDIDTDVPRLVRVPIDELQADTK